MPGAEDGSSDHQDPPEQAAAAAQRDGPVPRDAAAEPDAAAQPDQEVAVPGGRGGVGPGDEAPDFCLDGTGHHNYCLHDYRGEPVLLVFYPADNSPVCTQQLRSYSEDLNEFEELGATVLCLSPQDVASHEEFTAAQGLRLPAPLGHGQDGGPRLRDPGSAGLLPSVHLRRRSGWGDPLCPALAEQSDLCAYFGARRRHPGDGGFRRLRWSTTAGGELARFERVFALGIDPGLSRCGYGAVRGTGGRLSVETFGHLTTPAERPPERTAGHAVGRPDPAAGRAAAGRDGRRAGVVPGERPHRHGRGTGQRTGPGSRGPNGVPGGAIQPK